MTPMDIAIANMAQVYFKPVYEGTEGCLLMTMPMILDATITLLNRYGRKVTCNDDLTAEEIAICEACPAFSNANQNADTGHYYVKFRRECDAMTYFAPQMATQYATMAKFVSHTAARVETNSALYHQFPPSGEAHDLLSQARVAACGRDHIHEPKDYGSYRMAHEAMYHLSAWCTKRGVRWDAAKGKIMIKTDSGLLLSKKALLYIMGRLADPKVCDVLGYGTQAYEHLIQAVMHLTGQTRAALSEQYRPTGDATKRHRDATECARQLLRYCEESGITWNATEGEIETTHEECRFCGR